MLRRLLAIACLHLFALSVTAQEPRTKEFPTDAELHALVSKYVHTPVKKIWERRHPACIERVKREKNVSISNKLYRYADVFSSYRTH